MAAGPAAMGRIEDPDDCHQPSSDTAQTRGPLKVLFPILRENCGKQDGVRP